MRTDQQIEINRLLLQREELFVRINTLEKSAAALLGEPYPFTRPPLPSDQRSKRKPTAPRSSPAPDRDPLRPLEGLETSYRVTYHRAGETVQEEHDDPAPLRTLLACQGTHLVVLRLETIDLARRTKSVLFASLPAPEPSAPAAPAV